MRSLPPAVLFVGLMLIGSPAEGAAARPKDNRPPVSATDLWAPIPPVVSAEPGRPPSDAIVLFDGHNLDAWENASHPGQPVPWKVEGDHFTCVPNRGSIRTRQSFGDIQLHLEFRTPTKITGNGQKRGNSGVFFMGHYELQILDSYHNKTYVNGQAAAVYKQYPPLVNPSRPPGQWQTYDVIWIAPRFGKAGVLRRSARMTVFYNGVLVQYNVKVRGFTGPRGYPAYRPHPARLPLKLQDHHDPVEFRNIWVRELKLPD